MQPQHDHRTTTTTTTTTNDAAAAPAFDPRAFRFAQPNAPSSASDASRQSGATPTAPRDPHLPPPPPNPLPPECLAASADALAVYEEAVQEPLVECQNIDSLYYQAQRTDSDRPEARVLREDFCSSAAVAWTWLGLDARNESQGVDIDLDALVRTQRRLGTSRVALRQSAAFARARPIRVSDRHEPTEAPSAAGGRGSRGATSSESVEGGDGAARGRTVDNGSEAGTWAQGAASDRFERRFQARLAKERRRREREQQQQQQNQQHEEEKKQPLDQSQKISSSHHATAPAPRLTLVHSDVLDLTAVHDERAAAADSTIDPRSSTPAQPPPSAPTPAPGPGSAPPPLEPPDVIASLNYALCYFHTRAELIRYLRVARQTLRRRTGVLVCDQFLGPFTDPEEEYEAQDALWERFLREPGFARRGDPVAKLKGEALEVVSPGGGGATKAMGGGAQGHEAWPRGRLKLVRAGSAAGGFEYWREDGPVDWHTNRFRMSLSFRFSDKTWLRDVFSYDFRIWTLPEILEAMHEAGFARVETHVLPRNSDPAAAARRVGDVHDDDYDDDDDDDDDRRGDEDKGGDQRQERTRAATQREQHDGGGGGTDYGALDGVAKLLRRTEREEAARLHYRRLDAGDKVFATRSFGAYIVASVS